MGASNNDWGIRASNMAKKKRENLGVAVEVSGVGVGPVVSGLLPAAGSWVSLAAGWGRGLREAVRRTRVWKREAGGVRGPRVRTCRGTKLGEAEGAPKVGTGGEGTSRREET